MHKFVLSAHSKAFQAMFDDKNSIENTQSRLEIKDFDSDVVSQMLKYLYFGELPSEELTCENLVELLKISEQYQVGMLKSISEEKLIARF